jgi:hypothetical protein
MLRIEPVLPMLRMEPTLPMLSIDPALPMLRMDPALRRHPTLAKLMMLRELPLLGRFAPAVLTTLFRYAFSLKIHPPGRLSWWAVYGLRPRFVSKPGVGFADGRSAKRPSTCRLYPVFSDSFSDGRRDFVCEEFGLPQVVLGWPKDQGVHAVFENKSGERLDPP